MQAGTVYCQGDLDVEDAKETSRYYIHDKHVKHDHIYDLVDGILSQGRGFHLILSLVVGKLQEPGDVIDHRAQKDAENTFAVFTGCVGRARH